MKPGDLVKHYLTYSCGDIVKDIEYGVVLETDIFVDEQPTVCRVLKSSGEIQRMHFTSIEVISVD